MVRRRGLLRVLAGAAGTTAATALAGCSGDTDSPDGTATSDEQTPEGVDAERARAHFDDAIKELVETKETLDAWGAGESDWDQQTVNSLRNAVDRARTSLDDAEDVAPSDLRPRIDEARDVAGFQEALLDFYDVVIDFEATVADARAFGDTEQHERAAETYAAATDVLDRARTQLDEVETAHEQIDADRLDEPDLDYRGEHTEYLDLEGPGSIDAQELLVDGQRDVHRMFVELNAGFELYENEEFEAARDRFQNADEIRLQALDSFEAVREHDQAWRALRQQSIGMIGTMEELGDAIGLFVDATVEAEAENFEKANELAQEGFSVMEAAFE